jgi:hypothetical protein
MQQLTWRMTMKWSRRYATGPPLYNSWATVNMDSSTTCMPQVLCTCKEKYLLQRRNYIFMDVYCLLNQNLSHFLRECINMQSITGQKFVHVQERIQEKMVDIPAPIIVHYFNKYMGRVDYHHTLHGQLSCGLLFHVVPLCLPWLRIG